MSQVFVIDQQVLRDNRPISGWSWKEISNNGSDNISWIPANPSRDIRTPDSMAGRRMEMKVIIRKEPAVISTQVLLMIRQSVASAIFLDGKLLREFGSGVRNGQIIAYDPIYQPLALEITDTLAHELKVEFAVPAKARYTNLFGITNPIFEAAPIESVRYLDVQTRFSKWEELNNNVVVGITLMLSVLHFTFFLTNRKKRQNLFFALYALLYAVASLLISNRQEILTDVASKYIIGSTIMAFLNLGMLLLVIATQMVLGIQRKSLILIPSLLVFLLFIPGLTYTDAGFYLAGPVSQLVLRLCLVALGIYAYRKKLRHYPIILLFSISSFLFFLVFIMGGPLGEVTGFQLGLERFIFYFLAQISPGVGTSLLLALDFASTNRMLEERIRQNEVLAELALKKEQEKKAIIAEQKEKLEIQVAERTAELKQSLENLKSTQDQLIHSAKMASLGEMTAGIAHEIQNPLNFVNNFAEVNGEMTEDIKAEIRSAITDEGKRNEILSMLDELSQNQDRIQEHGKRADAIVKSMLHHSKSGSAQKEATDLNALVEEYVKLSFHGIRAKDKSFRADIDLQLDPSVGKVFILPQDFGRVILNLTNNAFYAVNEKRKMDIPGYEPKISITTRAIFGSTIPGSGTTDPMTDKRNPDADKRHPSSVVLTVTDNGNGIPAEILKKIFQPFFTTKPTGEGTGLGLSISYEIITRAHGGRLTADSEEGKGTSFHVEIPVENSTGIHEQELPRKQMND